MISHKTQKVSLNLAKTGKNATDNDINFDTKNKSIVDTFMQK
jgi:hypothetical protein